MRDLLKESLRSLMSHRIRTMLSGLGILFGVAAVIGILSIGEGARREQEALIAQLGILNIQIQQQDLPEDKEARRELQRRTSGLSTRDVDALASVLSGIEHIGGMRELKPHQVFPKPDDPEGLRFLGLQPGHLAGSPFTLLQGRPLRTKDEESTHRVCLVGEGAARELFGRTTVVGERLRIDQTWLTIVGVVRTGSGGETTLQGVDIEDRSRDVMLPLSTSQLVRPVRPGEPALDEIQITFAQLNAIPASANVVRRLLQRRHRDQPIFGLVVPLELMEQSAAQQRIFNLVMGLIAGISLLVGGIGIMNIMLASVMERTKEIAIRLAVGASPRDIQRLFLVEACLISLIGGGLGVLAGYAVSLVIALVTGWTTSVAPGAVLLASLVSMLEGLCFGYLPARRAAQMQPAMAVRMG